jgi:hypothetical protein
MPVSLLRFANQERLLSSMRNYSIFLYVSTIVVGLAPRMAVKAAPDAVASAQRFIAGGYDISVAIAFFTAATLLLQSYFARVLKPSPRLRLTPLAAWGLAVTTWVFITFFFLTCLTFGERNLGGCAEWAVAAGASVANFVMSARTVRVSRRASCDSLTASVFFISLVPLPLTKHDVMFSYFQISSVTSLEELRNEEEEEEWRKMLRR